MKLIKHIITIIFFIYGCSENPNETIHNYEVEKKYYNNETKIDIDGNGVKDIQSVLTFTGVDTVDQKYLLLLQDKTKIFHRDNRIAKLNIGDTIKYSESYNWSTIDSTIAVRRNIDSFHYWLGSLPGKTTYLGLQIYSRDSFYTAWINLTMDTNMQKIKFNFSNYCSKPNTDLIIK
ncbi:MAG: hypothetical protein IPH62_00185 [Ignavibacteriae bacterium]|nr:hypothetical protein [Ignavibacteriota bacterium]